MIEVFEFLFFSQMESTENRRHSMKRDVNRQPSPPPPLPPASSLSSFSSSSQCLASCQGVKHRPVCASDGVTYSSKCELRGVRECEKMELRVVSKGRCPSEENIRIQSVDILREISKKYLRKVCLQFLCCSGAIITVHTWNSKCFLVLL